MENLIKQFEKESGISATIESELYADGEIYAKEYTEWLEKRIQALSMSGVGCTFYCQRGDVTGSKRCEKQCEVCKPDY